MFPPVREITQLQSDAVQRWHRLPFEHPPNGFLALVSQQHEHNFRLWHEEDKARSPTANDAEIAQVKRNIDRLNQQRHDSIERLDDAIARTLEHSGVRPQDDTALNTETPGSVIDRLSIMSLRLFHYDEQLCRDDVDAGHRLTVTQRLARCRDQHVDLATSLQRLLDDLVAGRLRHKTYHQMKMYNDPTLNPAIYQNR